MTKDNSFNNKDKLCKDCKWCKVSMIKHLFKPPTPDYEEAKCFHPKVRGEEINLVTGIKTLGEPFICKHARLTGEPWQDAFCCSKARYWEAK